MLKSRETAIARVAELAELAKQARPKDFLAHAVTANELPESTALGILLRYWERLSEPEGHASLMNLLNKALGNRYVLVGQDHSTDKMVFREFGGGLFNHYEAWRANGVGVALDALPDHEYGLWAADAYKQVLVQGEPRIHDVDARQIAPHRPDLHALPARHCADHGGKQ